MEEGALDVGHSSVPLAVSLLYLSFEIPSVVLDHVYIHFTRQRRT